MSNKSKSILNKLYRQQRFLQLGVFSLVTVMIWMGFSLLQSQRSTSISKELKELAKPLTPTINTQLLDDISSKKAYSQNELASFPIYKIIISDDTTQSNIVTIDVEENDFLARPPSPSPTALGDQVIIPENNDTSENLENNTDNQN